MNVARLPHTTGRTLRVLWILLAPRYDYGDADPEILAKIAFAFIWEPLRLASEANNPLTAEHIKIHLGNHADRAFFAGVVSTLRGAPLVTAVAVRGNWLHLSLA